MRARGLCPRAFPAKRRPQDRAKASFRAATGANQRHRRPEASASAAALAGGRTHASGDGEATAGCGPRHAPGRNLVRARGLCPRALPAKRRPKTARKRSFRAANGPGPEASAGAAALARGRAYASGDGEATAGRGPRQALGRNPVRARGLCPRAFTREAANPRPRESAAFARRPDAKRRPQDRAKAQLSRGD